ncbi:MAG: alcohol dehydrogenase catalytic domain-containing protein, partial [Desulfobacterales bacterium]|nr:alcohol dehydrogenase catalytic domain-containing protein [Desulfobacterales bacterium]
MDIIKGLWRKYFNLNLPHILGHENAGWVEEVGNKVKSIEVGDPVIIHPRAFNGLCKACKRMRTPQAGDTLFPGMSSNGGGGGGLDGQEKKPLPPPAPPPPPRGAPRTRGGWCARY